MKTVLAMALIAAGSVAAAVSADQTEVIWNEFTTDLMAGRITPDRIRPYFPEMREPLMRTLEHFRQNSRPEDWKAKPVARTARLCGPRIFGGAADGFRSHSLRSWPKKRRTADRKAGGLRYLLGHKTASERQPCPRDSGGIRYAERTASGFFLAMVSSLSAA